MGRHSNGWLTVFALTSACNCGASQLQTALPDIHVTPTAIDFGNVYVQATPTRTFAVFNSGLGSDTVTIAPLADGGAFSVAPSTIPLAGGASVDVTAGFSPLVPGEASTTLNLAWSNGSATVVLQGNGLAWPACAPATACETASFDPNAGVCTETNVADGAACDGGDVCLVNTACANGQCLGLLNPCTDGGNACTTNYCVEGEGCHHDEIQCTGTNPCQVYACDPASGCTSNPAPDGTPCSATESCQMASVCLLGQCTGVAAPNGTPCALPWAPCVADATCQSGACDSPTADAYTPGQALWHFDAGVSPYQSFAVDAVGTSYPVYFDLDAGWVVAAIDSCGHELWHTAYPGYGSTMLLGGDVYLVGMSAVAQLSTVGVLQWSVPLWNLDGGPFQEGAAALSNQGSLSIAGFNIFADPGGGVLLDLSAGGSPSFLQQLGNTFSPGNLLSDRGGNTYFSSTLICPQSECSSATAGGSFDPLGRLRFPLGDAPGASFQPLAIGADYVLAAVTPVYSGASQIGAFALVDGRHLYTAPTPLWLGNLWPWNGGAVIDAAGTAYVLGENQGSLLTWQIEALGRDGSSPWMSSLPAGLVPLSPLALGDPGTLFLQAEGDAGIVLLAFDTTTGQESWQKPIAPTWRAADDGDGSPLALSSASELLVSDPTGLTAYFANQAVAPVGAPWPQAGGDATNRNCPPP